MIMDSAFDVSDFLHPLDLSARQHLESVPLLEKAVTKYQSMVAERKMRQELMVSAIRLGPRQLPSYYRLLPPICDAFGIEEPELYLTRGPANAMTVGHGKTAIIIYSDLLEDLSEEEVQAVLAHECGHILARHTLYREMAVTLIRAGSVASAGAPVLGQLASRAVQGALLDWFRKSELTADRAAVAFLRGPETMRRALFHIIGVPKWMPGEISDEGFAEQANEFDSITETRWDRFLSRSLESGSTHPMPVIRMRELTAWAKSTQFEQLMKITVDRRSVDGAGCEHCGRQLVPEWRFCQHCGASVP
jgi:Zn-dependent protease with chaperone function